LTGKEEKSKLIVARSGIWRQRFDFKGFSTMGDSMPIRIRRLDKLPIHCNMLIQKEMPAQIFGLQRDVMRARKRNSASYADRSNIC